MSAAAPRRARLLFLNNQGLGSMGGGVTILRRLVASLAADFDVSVMSFDAPASQNGAAIRQIALHPLPSPGSLWRFAPLLRARALSRTIAASEIDAADVVVALDCHFANLVTRARPKRLIYLSLSCIPRQEWFGNSGSQRVLQFLQYVLLERKIAAAADVVMVSSALHAGELRRYLRLPQLKPVVIYPLFPAATPPIRKAEDNTVTILSAGRLVPGKNFDAVIALAERLRDLPCRFVIAGEGPEEERLRARVKTSGLEDKILFPGIVSDLDRLLASADIFLHPSLYESFGIAMFEAMRSGLAPVGARGRAIVGYAELIRDGSNGFLVDFDRPDEAAIVLRTLVADPLLRARIGKAAKETADKILANDYCASFRNVLDNLLERQAA